eukprot:10035688-Lingulodinium_polyedra.AAC.1
MRRSHMNPCLKTKPEFYSACQKRTRACATTQHTSLPDDIVLNTEVPWMPTARMSLPERMHTTCATTLGNCHKAAFGQNATGQCTEMLPAQTRARVKGPDRWPAGVAGSSPA